jgi:MFS family permease
MTTNVMDTPKSSSILPMAIVAVLFFILGFATWLNGSLMPYLSQILKLTPFQGSLILFSFYIAVTFTALPSAMLIKKVGYKNGMARHGVDDDCRLVIYSCCDVASFSFIFVGTASDGRRTNIASNCG